MAKTEVILIQPIVGLGAESDQVKVAAGYARNYLFPRGIAIPLTGSNKKRIEALQKRRAEREAHELNSMTDLAKGLSKMTLTITVKTGEDGKMFGSVTPGSIADELKKQFEIDLDKRKIHIEGHSLRATGDHEVEMRLHHGLNATLKVKIESSTPVAKPVEVTAPAKAPEVQEDRRKSRGPRKEKSA